jgi:hypothetical protein
MIQPRHGRSGRISHISNGYLKSTDNTTNPDMEEASAAPPHPLDIKPVGNAFTATYNLRNVSGGLFLALTDELIIRILEFLDGSSLLRVGATCKVLYAFARADDLWKTLFIE